MRQKNKNAFTLVELIVVVTIIAILGTVGFISYSNYLTTARDSNRISQLTRIADALQVYTTRNSLPLPDNSVTITASWTTIAYQWDLGEAVLQTIDYSTTARDPKDNTPFTYFLSADRLNFQLLAFMEDSKSLQANNLGITQTYANIYQNRFPKTYGRRLWVLTDAENTPIQELSLPWNTLNVLNVGTLTLKSFLSDTEFVTGTQTNFVPLESLIKKQWKFWSVIDNEFKLKCSNADDIQIGQYTISACNIWSEYVMDFGRLFQWWENVAWDASSWLTTANNCTWDRDTQSCTTPSLSAWSSSVWDTTSWGTDRWLDYGDTRWPCLLWYRVPSVTDWQGIVTAWWWGTNGTAMQTALQLPYAGYRNSSNGTWLNGGSSGYYWSSSPSGTNGYILIFSSSSILPSNAIDRASGFSVRCFKN